MWSHGSFRRHTQLRGTCCNRNSFPFKVDLGELLVVQWCMSHGLLGLNDECWVVFYDHIWLIFRPICRSSSQPSHRAARAILVACGMLSYSCEGGWPRKNAPERKTEKKNTVMMCNIWSCLIARHSSPFLRLCQVDIAFAILYTVPDSGVAFGRAVYLHGYDVGMMHLVKPV